MTAIQTVENGMETGETFVDKGSTSSSRADLTSPLILSLLKDEKTLIWKSYSSQQNPVLNDIPPFPAPVSEVTCNSMTVPQSKFLVTRRSRRVTQSKFFERVWGNFCSQKFLQLPFPESFYYCLNRSKL